MRYPDANSGVTRRELKINSLKGMDLREGDDISRGRSVVNFIPEGSYLRKRKGFTEIYNFEQPIDCIGEVHLQGKSLILIFCGGRFYLRGDDMKDISDSATENPLDYDKITEKTFEVFEHDGKNYIIGLGDYLVLGVWNNEIQLRRVYGSSDVYIPTTSQGISPVSTAVFVQDYGVDESTRGVRYINENGTYKEVTLDGSEGSFSTETTYYKRVGSNSISPITLESPNLLTDYRINTLFPSSEGEARYYLDCSVAIGNNTLSFTGIKDGVEKKYLLHEVESDSVTRAIEIGDDLSGKTVTIGKDFQDIVVMDLVKYEQEVLMKMGDYRIKWFPVCEKGDKWNIAELRLIKQNDSSSPIVIATAERNSSVNAYNINYYPLEYTFSEASPLIVEEYNDIIGFNKVVQIDGLPASLYYLYDEEDNLWGTLNHETGELILTNCVSFKENEEIKVTFRGANIGEKNYISRCGFGQAFGVNGNSDRLFFSGNKEYPNYDFMSDSNNPLYFPADGISVFGEYASITGYARLSDNAQAIFKEKQGRDCTVYIRRGIYSSSTTTLGGESITQRSGDFYLDGSFSADGCCSFNSIGFLNGAPIFLSENGIKGLKTSVNKANESRYTVDVGLSIKELLKNTDLSRVCGVNYKDYYLLNIGETLLVAKEGETFSSGQCEWWTIKGFDATYITVIGNKLYFGNTHGGLCTLNDGFEDYYIENLYAGDLSFSLGSKYVEVSSKLNISVGTRIYLEGELYKLIQYECRKEGDGFYVGDDIIYYVEGEKIYVSASEKLGKDADTEYEVREVDYENGTFCIYCDGEKVHTITGFLYSLYQKVSSRLLYVTDKKCGLGNKPDVITLSEWENGEEIVFKAMNGVMNYKRGYVVTVKPVIAEWKSVDLNFGNSGKLKNIYGVSFDYSTQSRGNVEVLCYSERAEQRLAYNNCAKYDFALGDLSSIGFEGGLRKNCYLRCRLKGVTHARIAVISRDGKEFEFKNLSIEYAYIGKNGGVN